MTTLMVAATVGDGGEIEESLFLLSVRERIMRAVKARLSSAGYGWTIGRGLQSLDDARLPAVIVWDGAETGAIDQYGAQTFSSSLTIEAMVECGADAEQAVSDANQIMAQVVSVMIYGDKTFGGIADTILYRRATPILPQDGQRITGARIEFDVEYQTLLGDPYRTSS